MWSSTASNWGVFFDILTILIKNTTNHIMIPKGGKGVVIISIKVTLMWKEDISLCNDRK